VLAIFVAMIMLGGVTGFIAEMILRLY